jgi:predicted phosphoribosyltransferase
MIFSDRNDAAHRLARALEKFRGRHPLVLAIPRGAVPMGEILARSLDGDLDVVLVRKLRAPDNPEFAIGSVAESGWSFVAPYAERAGATPAYLEEEKRIQLDTIRRRRERYTPLRPPIDPSGRLVIVVDDGLATGSTMISALHSIREKKPSLLVCAVPVAPEDTLERVRPLADETVCLEVPEYFQAVGEFYFDFPQVTDDEVEAALRRAGKNAR